jgi:UDP-2,3-diacylglucosamine hydrolase
MKALFISDAHLKGVKDRQYDRIIKLFEVEQTTMDTLFILGDFFDFWFCNNGNVYPGFRRMIDKLFELRDRGVAISYFEGNHDFFLDEFFKGSGIRVFPDGADLDLDGRKIYVSHGDTVDLSNRRYLLLRRFLRSRVFYLVQNALPSVLLWQIARLSSRMSKDHLAKPPEGLAAAMREFSMTKFRDGYDAVILGHCHQPVLEQYMVGGRKRTFGITGDWEDNCSYIKYVDGTFRHSVLQPN